MSSVATIAAVATVAGAAISSDASRSSANKAADASQNAAQTSANAQLQALGLVQAQEAPYNQAGQQALGQYQNLLQGGAANFDISKLPGYQFEMQQGTNAIQNSAAARGQALSGNTLQGLQQYGQGLASTQFQQYMQQLAGLANMGQAAASNTANLGAGLLSGAGASLASGIQASGQYQAAAGVGQANAWNGALQGLAGNQSLMGLFNQNTSGQGNLGQGGGLTGGNPVVDPNSGATAL
jgi:hypothetical protein